MTQRLNFRISDEISHSIQRIAEEVQERGGEGTISNIARRLLEEGLRSMQGKEEDSTPNDKGRKFELRILDDIRAALWDADVKRLKVNKGKRTPDIRGPFFDFECKIGKRPSTRQALDQVRASKAPDQAPVAIVQDDDDLRGPFVVMEWSTFLALYRAAYELAIFSDDLPRRLNRVEK
jgi:hypothetical protein